MYERKLKGRKKTRRMYVCVKPLALKIRSAAEVGVVAGTLAVQPALHAAGRVHHSPLSAAPQAGTLAAARRVEVE